MRNYEGRIKAIEKKLPKPEPEPFQTYHLERDGTYSGDNGEVLTKEELDALDCNMFIVGWQRHWTDEETEANGLNAQRHNMRDWLEGMRKESSDKYLDTIPKLESHIEDIETELKRKGLPIEEERDNRPGAGSVEIRVKGE